MRLLLLLALTSPYLHAASVTFLAIGKPAMVKIRGECKDSTYAKGPGKIAAVVKLDRCDTGIALRNQHMREKYLQTKQFPEAKLTANIPASGAGRFTGELTLHGKTALVEGDIDAQGLSFSTHISEFGIAVPSFLGVTVTDEVQVSAKF